MTDATKASRSPAAQKSAAKSAPSTKTRGPAGNDDADIRAGEAAWREAAGLTGSPASASGQPARGAQKAATKIAAKAKQKAKPAKAAPPPAAKPEGPAQMPANGPIPAPPEPGAWMSAARDWQETVLRAGTRWAESQMASAGTSTALGFKLIDFAMAHAAAQLGAVRAMASAKSPAAAADIQRKFAEETFAKAAEQANEARTLLSELVDSAARPWKALNAGPISGKENAS